VRIVAVSCHVGDDGEVISDDDGEDDGKKRKRETRRADVHRT
jgi:hypothetical protein